MDEENKQPGIGGKQFKLNLNPQRGIRLQVISEPEPYTKKNKSKWQIINWYRKWRGTYYESGYKYNVKIVKDE